MTTESNTGSSPISIAALAEGVAFAVAVAFVVSVIYDWGFVFALGLEFAYIPTTTADHFRSGLLWFPPLLALLLFIIAIEFQFQRVERGLTEKELIESSSNPEAMRKFREGPQKLIIWSAPLMVLSYVLMGDAFSSVLPLMLAITWMGFAEWCYSAPLIRLRRNKQLQLAFTFLPIVGIFAFFSGYNAAVDAAFRKPFEVTIERSASSAAIPGNLLRTLDKGILLLGEKKSFHFVPWDQVQAIHNKNTYKPYRGVLCNWFNLCFDVEQAKVKTSSN